MKNINSELIWLKDQNWLQKQRIAGKCVASCLQACRDLISSSEKISGQDLERLCQEIFDKFNCLPTFYQYCGRGKIPFPGKICVSVNKVLVHGIPNSTPFADGDVIKVDLGATYQDTVADAATTFIKGNPKNNNHLELITTAKLALQKAIENCLPGKQLGGIGQAIYRTVRNTKFGLITEYGGHGIDSHARPHAPPFVPNKSLATEGVRIQPGMVLAIEPQLTLGPPLTRVDSDGWSVKTPDIGAHEEHTVFIHNDGPEIITQWN